MEFNQVKNFCKYAGPGILCPDNYKHCNADNCPLAILDKYRADARRAKQELIRTEESYKDLLEQYDVVKAELEESTNKSLGLIYTTLCDLKDKIKTTLKRLEP